MKNVIRKIIGKKKTVTFLLCLVDLMTSVSFFSLSNIITNNNHQAKHDYYNNV